MISGPIIHPLLLTSLASAGHGSRVLIADANYPCRTASGPNADIVYLNLAPGTVRAVTVLAAIEQLIAVEQATVMVPDTGPEPEIFADYRRLLPSLGLETTDRHGFYDLARGDDVSTVVATGELQLYANILLTIGVQPGLPSSPSTHAAAGPT